MSKTQRPPAPALGPITASLLLGGAFTAAVACAQQPSTPAPDPTAAMAHEHAHDAPAPSPAVGRAGGAHEVATRSVDYATIGGKAVSGAFAQPKDWKKGGPAVIVIQEWWGLNDNIRDQARQLASHGYAALAVDLYQGKSAQEPGAAQALMKEAMGNRAAIEDNLRQAYAFLEKEGAGKVGVIGWCFGGGWSLQTGLLLPDKIDAVVMYYGFPEADRAKLAKLQAPLLGLFGEKDQAVKPEMVQQFQAALGELEKNAIIRTFPGAGHAFANPSGGSYVQAAADEAWKLTLYFFGEHLR